MSVTAENIVIVPIIFWDVAMTPAQTEVTTTADWVDCREDVFWQWTVGEILLLPDKLLVNPVTTNSEDAD